MDATTSIDIQGDGSHSDPHHAFRMVEELDGFSVQGEVVRVLVGSNINTFVISQKMIDVNS